jgi:hypothetical protein
VSHHRTATVAARPSPPATATSHATMTAGLRNVAAARAAGNVHGAPDATADDECAAQLVGDVGPAAACTAHGLAGHEAVEEAAPHGPVIGDAQESSVGTNGSSCAPGKQPRRSCRTTGVHRASRG